MASLGELSGTGGEDIKAAATRLREVADTLAVTAARFDRLVAENEGNVDRFADQGLAEIRAAHCARRARPCGASTR